MVRAVISYSHQDKDLLSTRLLPALRSLEVETWCDHDIAPGKFWVDEVQRALSRGDWIVILLGPGYQASVRKCVGPCYHELTWILNHVTKVRYPPTIVVVRQDGEVPSLLSTYQYIDVEQTWDVLPGKLKPLLETEAVTQQQRSQPQESDLSPPEVNGPDTLPELARYNFQQLARYYNQQLFVGNAMQAQNAVVLLSQLNEVIKQRRHPRPTSWLDAGCGTGLVATIARAKKGVHGCGWLLNCGVRCAVDYAAQMLDLLPAHYTTAFEADLRKITVEDLQRNTGTHALDLIIANNVLHWLFDEEQIKKALARCRDLLRDGGLLAASIAAVGTGSYFQQAYQAEIEEALASDERKKWTDHIANPIGLQKLERMIKVAHAVGFTIEAARQVYEPREYNGTDEYIDDARSYGDGVFMAPLMRRDANYREEIWQRIERRFRDLYTTASSYGGYIHDQYMIYLVARRVD